MGRAIERGRRDLSGAEWTILRVGIGGRERFDGSNVERRTELSPDAIGSASQLRSKGKTIDEPVQISPSPTTRSKIPFSCGLPSFLNFPFITAPSALRIISQIFNAPIESTEINPILLRSFPVDSEFAAKGMGKDARRSIGRVWDLRAKRKGRGSRDLATGGAAPVGMLIFDNEPFPSFSSTTEVGKVDSMSCVNVGNETRAARSRFSNVARSQILISLSDEAVMRILRYGMTCNALMKSVWAIVVDK